jgi:hypothetical protein
VALGQELRPALGPVVVGLQQRREETLAQLVGGMRAQRADEPGGADDWAGMPALTGLGEEMEERCLFDRSRADDARSPNRAPGTVVGGIELDLPVGTEPRRIALALLDRRVDHVHHDALEVAGYRR